MTDAIVVTDQDIWEREHFPDVDIIPDAKPEWNLPVMEPITLSVIIPEEWDKWLKRTRKELGFDQ